MTRNGKQLGSHCHGTKKSGTRVTKNGYINVVSPATASQIRKTLGITAAQSKNVLRVFRAAGVEV